MSYGEYRGYTRLNQLYADLSFLNFQLDYLHDSLGNYYSKRQPHWTPEYRREQIEDIRASIPQVYDDINDIKKEIELELSYIYGETMEREATEEYEYY